MCVCVCVYVYTHTHTHTHIYMYIYIYINKPDKDMSNFIWKILHMKIKNHGERKCIEALEIKKYSDNVMNGCIGRTICI